MIESIKNLLGIALTDTSKDTIINIHINSFKAKILAYCGLDALPEALEYAVIEMVVDVMGTGKVKSIQRGDTQIQYATSDAKQFPGSWASELNRFRKVKMI